MKLEFYTAETREKIGDGVELDGRIPVPRIGETVVLAPGYFQYRVVSVSHVYATERVFIFVDQC